MSLPLCASGRAGGEGVEAASIQKIGEGETVGLFSVVPQKTPMESPFGIFLPYLFDDLGPDGMYCFDVLLGIAGSDLWLPVQSGSVASVQR